MIGQVIRNTKMISMKFLINTIFIWENKDLLYIVQVSIPLINFYQVSIFYETKFQISQKFFETRHVIDVHCFIWILEQKNAFLK